MKRKKDRGIAFSDIQPLKTINNSIIKKSGINGARAFVNFKLGIIRGALFSFDVFPGNSIYKDCFGISWPHFCEKGLMILELLRFMKEINVEDMNSILFQFTNDIGETTTLKYHNIDSNVLINKLNQNNCYIFFNASHSNIKVFADLEPNFDDKEMQTGLIIEKELFKGHVNQIVDLLISTSILRSGENDEISEFKGHYSSTIYYLINLF